MASKGASAHKVTIDVICMIQGEEKARNMHPECVNGFHRRSFASTELRLWAAVNGLRLAKAKSQLSFVSVLRHCQV